MGNMLLSDIEIAELCAKHKMITPFVRKQKAEGVISYGLSSYGYDIRVSKEFKIFTNVNSSFVDPKHFDAKSFVDVKKDVALIPPNSFALSRSLEYFKIPDEIFGMAVGKSTYARCGIVTNVTPLEPGWEGYLTLEISNTTPLPARIYAGEGIVQIVFFKGKRPAHPYTTKGGKYQGQLGITLPKV